MRDKFVSFAGSRVMESQTKSKKFWKPPSFEDFNVPIPNKKIKLDSDDFLEEKSPNVLYEPKEPKSVSELATHPKKILEVRNWIRCSHSERAPILLLTGPAGSGKTTTLKVSAYEEGVSVKEWINPVDKTEFKAESVFQNDIYDKFNYSESKQSDKFDDFVFQSSRYKSLFEKEESTLILVEDIPNIFVWRPKQFHSFLEKYKSHGRSPIVFIITDDQTLNLSSNLFPSHIKSKYNITNIKFNPVNHSSLVKNLKLLSEAHCSDKVSSQVLESIIKNSGGDVRYAVNDLLLFLRTSGSSLTQLPKKSKRGKKNEGLEVGTKALSLKDTTCDFYHVIGRILYPKLMSEKEKSDCKNPKRIFLHDIHQIAASWRSSFLGILHENYLQTFTKLTDVVAGAECFSFCDVLDRQEDLEEYVNLTGTITLMLSNTEPKKNGFNPIKKSLHLDSNSSDCDLDMEEHFSNLRLSKRDFLMDVSPFLKILKVGDKSDAQLSQIKEGSEESDDEVIEIEEFDD